MQGSKIKHIYYLPSFSLQQLMPQLTHVYASYWELEVAAFKLLQLMYICKLLCNSPLTPELHL